MFELYLADKKITYTTLNFILLLKISFECYLSMKSILDHLVFFFHIFIIMQIYNIKLFLY